MCNPPVGSRAMDYAREDGPRRSRIGGVRRGERATNNDTCDQQFFFISCPMCRSVACVQTFSTCTAPFQTKKGSPYAVTTKEKRIKWLLFFTPKKGLTFWFARSMVGCAVSVAQPATVFLLWPQKREWFFRRFKTQTIKRPVHAGQNATHLSCAALVGCVFFHFVVSRQAEKTFFPQKKIGPEGKITVRPRERPRRRRVQHTPSGCRGEGQCCLGGRSVHLACQHIRPPPRCRCKSIGRQSARPVLACAPRNSALASQTLW